MADRIAVLKTACCNSRVTAIYARPDNVFVAGFIGSPSMNFMSGTLEEGKLRTALGDIPVAGQLQQDLAGANVGRDVIVGIRPENFEDGALVPAENRRNGMTFPATIDVVESLGSEKFVYYSKELGAVETAELAELARVFRAGGQRSCRGDGGGPARSGHPDHRRAGHRAVGGCPGGARVRPRAGRNLTRGCSGASAAPPRRPRAAAAPAAAPMIPPGQDTGSTATPPR